MEPRPAGAVSLGLDFHGAGFVVGLTGGQRHDHWDASVYSGDWRGAFFQHGSDESTQLAGKAFGITIHEKIERQVAVYRSSGADFGQVGITVFGGDFAGAA